MKKDFTITAEVRLLAHWNAPMNSPEDWERRRVIDDKLGVIACDLDKVIEGLVEELIPEE
jgi:hypothetical protein